MLRLRQVALVTRDLDGLVDQFRTVFALAEGHDDPHMAQLQLRNRVLVIGDQFLEIVTPLTTGITAERYLTKRAGDAGYMLIFQTDDHAARMARVTELGVRVVARFDAPGFTNAQLHPADTGGAFFEIDQQDGDEWSPAGGPWRHWQATELVTAITGATIACPDPVATAARWADLLGTEADGPTLLTDDGPIAFVAEANQPGIVALTLASPDPDRALTTARRLGLAVDGQQLILGGLRIELT